MRAQTLCSFPNFVASYLNGRCILSAGRLRVRVPLNWTKMLGVSQLRVFGISEVRHSVYRLARQQQMTPTTTKWVEGGDRQLVVPDHGHSGSSLAI